MRIVSGKYKGRYIPVRKNFPARPTTDFAKENIFNVISNYFDFELLHVLDLFGGTGSISFEFASRGSIEVVTVEKDFRSCSFIKKTAESLEMNQLKVIKSDVFRTIPKLNTHFDIVFADPPYKLDRISEIPDLVFENNLLKNEGWLILEHGKANNFSNNKSLIDSRIYGSVHFSIFQKK
jgi:16S rRNA (guanine(966)-N(2))-methyltransferase RsmD